MSTRNITGDLLLSNRSPHRAGGSLIHVSTSPTVASPLPAASASASASAFASAALFLFVHFPQHQDFIAVFYKTFLSLSPRGFMYGWLDSRPSTNMVVPPLRRRKVVVAPSDSSRVDLLSDHPVMLTFNLFGMVYDIQTAFT